MQHLHRLTIAAIVAIGFALPAGAQEAPIKQIALTEKRVLGYIAAQTVIAPIIEKAQRGKPDIEKVKAEIDGVAKKHGFASLEEYEVVAANVAMIMDGLDPVTKAFTEPQDALKKDIEEIQADKSIPAKEKREMLEELNEALKTAQPVQHRGNIELVKKHYEQLEVALQ